MPEITESFIEPSNINTGNVNKENPLRMLNLGTAFEHFTSATFDPGQVLKMGEISSALLATNEDANFSIINKMLGKHPDGYIYGVGAGTVFAVSSLFDKKGIPKAILSVDLLPEAVMAGRVVVMLLKLSKNYGAFIKNLQSRPVLQTAVDSVIQSETSEELCSIFKKIDVSKLLDILEQTTQSVPSRGIVQDGRYKDTISIVASIRENFQMLKQLADEGNIGFGLADYYQPSVLDYIRSQPDFLSARNVIYTSNLIDYVNIIQDETSLDPRWTSFKKALKSLDNPHNIFLFTTKECDLTLFSSNGLPSSVPSDFWL